MRSRPRSANVFHVVFAVVQPSCSRLMLFATMRPTSAPAAAPPAPAMTHSARAMLLERRLLGRPLPREIEERVELPVERGLARAGGVLEETREPGHDARLALAGGEVDETRQIEDKRRRQRAVGAAPRELERAARPEEALEVDVIPGRLP